MSCEKSTESIVLFFFEVTDSILKKMSLKSLQKEEKLDPNRIPNNFAATAVGLVSLPVINIPAQYGKKGVPLVFSFNIWWLERLVLKLFEVGYTFEQATVMRSPLNSNHDPVVDF